MPRVSIRPRPLQWQVFRARDAFEAGLLTPTMLRTPAWRRILRGIYADSRLEVDHHLRCQAAGLAVPPDALIAGPSAAYLLGAESAVRDADPVHLLVPRKHRFGPVQGLRVHTTGDLDAADLASARGLPCTSASRTAWDVVLWQDLVRAVTTLDAMLRVGLVTKDELIHRLERNRRDGVRGWGRAQRAFGLADGRAQSPPESEVRVRLILHGLPPPVPQHPVRVRSGRLLHPDLAWPEYRVAVEYDGAYHSDPEQMHLDRRRLNELVDAGWIVLHVTSRRLRGDFAGLVREVREALRSRGAPV